MNSDRRPLNAVADLLRKQLEMIQALGQGPPSIRTENAQLVDYIYVDMQGRDLGGYVNDARKAVEAQVKLPPGAHLEWSGQFEYLHALWLGSRS